MCIAYRFFYTIRNVSLLSRYVQCDVVVAHRNRLKRQSKRVPIKHSVVPLHCLSFVVEQLRVESRQVYHSLESCFSSELHSSIRSGTMTVRQMLSITMTNAINHHVNAQMLSITMSQKWLSRNCFMCFMKSCVSEMLHETTAWLCHRNVETLRIMIGKLLFIRTALFKLFSLDKCSNYRSEALCFCSHPKERCQFHQTLTCKDCSLCSRRWQFHQTLTCKVHGLCSRRWQFRQTCLSSPSTPDT